MSWFAEQNVIADDERAGTEIAEGALVERREVLGISLGALAALSLGWPQRAVAEEPAAPAADPDSGELAWDTLLQKTLPMAERLVASKKPNEDAYLFQLMSFITRLNKAPDAEFKNAPVASAQTYRKMPLVVVQFKIQPGAAIPYHDHRDYIGILSSVSGEARVRSFEVVGADTRPPKGKSFDIRETHDGLLFPGRASVLSRSRDNIHDVRAGKEGARLLDFFTFFNPAGQSVFLDVQEKPRDPEKRIFEAAWK